MVDVACNTVTGMDLSHTKAGTEKLNGDLLVKRPRVVWVTPPCCTQRTHQPQSRSKFHRIPVNILNVFLWLVEQDDKCETILEQMWATSHYCDGVFSEMKEQFHGGRAPGVSGMLSLLDVSHQNPGTSNVHINVGQICCVPDHVFVITSIKRWRRKRCNTHRKSSRLLLRRS